ncbi:5031_t:CDS:2, partial [Gigaspora margarita]
YPLCGTKNRFARDLIAPRLLRLSMVKISLPAEDNSLSGNCLIVETNFALLDDFSLVDASSLVDAPSLVDAILS